MGPHLAGFSRRPMRHVGPVLRTPGRSSGAQRTITDWLGGKTLRSCDCVVIGGGIIGLFAAYRLQRGGLQVAVVERDLCGHGTTAKATGGVRTQFGSEVNIRMSLLSLPHFCNWGDLYGGSVDFRQIGYLFVTNRPDQFANLETGARLQRGCGAQVRSVTPSEIRDLAPMLRVDDLVGGTFGPDDGVADPGAAVVSIEAACRRAGVDIFERTPVTGIRLEGDRVVGVQTASGEFACPVAVIAAGPWSRPIGAMAGLELPIEPHHRQVYRTGALAAIPRATPLVVDLATGVYFHGEGDGVIFGGGDRESEAGFDDAVRPDEAARIVGILVDRVPAFEQAALMRTWAGLREMTPDDHGILGPAPGVEGLYVAAGFSGHGFMQSPAIGEVLSRMVLGEEPMLDVSQLAVERFASRLKGETHVF